MRLAYAPVRGVGCVGERGQKHFHEHGDVPHDQVAEHALQLGHRHAAQRLVAFNLNVALDVSHLRHAPFGTNRSMNTPTPKTACRLRSRGAAYLLAFIVGSCLGLAVLKLATLYADHTGQAVPLPRFWVWWLFDANPIVRVVCDALQRSDVCVGLPLDGGPLEGAELGWLVFAQGTPFGLVATFALRWSLRRAPPQTR